MMETESSSHSGCHDCCGSKQKTDWLLWITLAMVVVATGVYFLGTEIPYLDTFAKSVALLLNEMYVGLLLGILFISILSSVPAHLVSAVIGKPGSAAGVVRATLAGIVLDLCNHGILLVGVQLYKKGASLGQVFAFLIASPWNSFSLTIILISLIGWMWTGVFIIASMLIAIVTGLMVDLVIYKSADSSKRENDDMKEAEPFTALWKSFWQSRTWTLTAIGKGLWNGLKESKMLLRWIFLGIVLTAFIQTFVSTEFLSHYFGASLLGLLLTLVASTIIEVCSEGSVPIASDLFTRAAAPGNAFTFLMAGASTDFTEMMLLRETTQSWKKTLLLPLLTVPQVLILGWIMNQ